MYKDFLKAHDCKLLVKVRGGLHGINVIFGSDSNWERVRFEKFTPNGTLCLRREFKRGAFDYKRYADVDRYLRLANRFHKSVASIYSCRKPIEGRLKAIQTHRFKISEEIVFSSDVDLDDDWNLRR